MPESLTAWKSKARIYTEDLHNYEKGLECYETVQILSSNDTIQQVIVLNNMAECLNKLQKHLGAIVILKKA